MAVPLAASPGRVALRARRKDDALPTKHELTLDRTGRFLA
jgi:hypothetical protein